MMRVAQVADTQSSISELLTAFNFCCDSLSLDAQKKWQGSVKFLRETMPQLVLQALSKPAENVNNLTKVTIEFAWLAFSLTFDELDEPQQIHDDTKDVLANL